MTRATTMLSALAVAYGNKAAKVSLHTADPGITGASEVAGGTYARATLTWVNNGDGSVTGTATVNVPAGTDVTHVALWDSLNGFLDSTEGVGSFPTNGTANVTLTYTQS
jgi:hypothetical protein